jgi:predicted dehydrogenase
MKNQKSMPFRLGFIGGSVNSAIGYTHFVSCRMDNKWNVGAGCFSRNEKINYQTGLEYGVSKNRLYHNWQDMLVKEKGNLDAISILLPSPHHYTAVKDCINAGYPVICDKPIAVNSKESKSIRDLIKKKNGFAAVTYNYSGYPMVRELKEIILRGKLGNILHIIAEMPQEGYINQSKSGKTQLPQEWRLKDLEIPVIYLDLFVHLHHLIYYLTEEKPVEVIADNASYGIHRNVIDYVSCLALYTGRIKCNIWFSKSSSGNRNGLRIRIFGSKGSADWVQENPEKLNLAFADGRREIVDRASKTEIAGMKRYNRFKSGHPAGFIEAFANLYTDFSDDLKKYLSRSASVNKFYSSSVAHEGLVFCEALVQSIKSRSWQKIK